MKYKIIPEKDSVMCKVIEFSDDEKSAKEFYLPQWIADELLEKSKSELESIRAKTAVDTLDFSK